MYNLWEALLGVLRGLFYYIFDFLVGEGTNIISQLTAALVANVPGPVAGAVTACAPYLEIANAWAPIDYMFLLVGGYYVVAVTTYTVRHIVKLIPTIG